MTINEIITKVEQLCPISYQEDYDNCGLLTGNRKWNCKGILISLDCTEDIVDEAIKKGCNLIIAHHPIIFRGMKKITGKNYVERTVITAIKNDIAIYAAHTNLDNVLNGVNGKIAEKLGLLNLKILRPRDAQLNKLITFAPLDVAEKVRNALFDAGGGAIGKYSECSFNIEGTGTFKPMEGSNPETGEIGKRYEGKEVKIEIIFPVYLKEQIIRAMIEAHPYEEVAYDILSLGNHLSDVGSGVIGDLPEFLSESDLFQLIKREFGCKTIKHSAFLNKDVKRIAVCGGAGSFLISDAIKSGADIFVTSDLKYHEYFDADNQLVLADIGHYESEQFTKDLLYEFLNEKNLNFAVLKSEVNTNPVSYFL